MLQTWNYFFYVQGTSRHQSQLQYRGIWCAATEPAVHGVMHCVSIQELRKQVTAGRRQVAGKSHTTLVTTLRPQVAKNRKIAEFSTPTN